MKINLEKFISLAWHLPKNLTISRYPLQKVAFLIKQTISQFRCIIRDFNALEVLSSFMILWFFQLLQFLLFSHSITFWLSDPMDTESLAITARNCFFEFLWALSSGSTLMILAFTLCSEYLSFPFIIGPSSEQSAFITSSIEWFYFFAVQGILNNFP